MSAPTHRMTTRSKAPEAARQEAEAAAAAIQKVAEQQQAEKELDAAMEGIAAAHRQEEAGTPASRSLKRSQLQQNPRKRFSRAPPEQPSEPSAKKAKADIPRPASPTPAEAQADEDPLVLKMMAALEEFQQKEEAASKASEAEYSPTTPNQEESDDEEVERAMSPTSPSHFPEAYPVLCRFAPTSPSYSPRSPAPAASRPVSPEY